MKDFDFTKLKYAQDNCCAICNRSFSSTMSYVDVDKETDLVRGLLCETCDLALSHFKDNLKILESAVKYLKKGSICS